TLRVTRNRIDFAVQNRCCLLGLYVKSYRSLSCGGYWRRSTCRSGTLGANEFALLVEDDAKLFFERQTSQDIVDFTATSDAVLSSVFTPVSPRYQMLHCCFFPRQSNAA